MIEKKRIYIIVKTYPTISDKYSELVCTAGVLEDVSWIRLYPIPFRNIHGYKFKLNVINKIFALKHIDQLI